jgi:hypothetical protein
MSGFPWFPLGYRIPACMIGPLRREDFGYQIVAGHGTEKVALVLEASSLIGRAAENLPNSSLGGFSSFEFGGRSYLSRVFDKDQQPIIIGEWSKMAGLPTSSEIAELCKAIHSLRRRFPKADVGRALYLSPFGECLPVIETEKSQDLSAVAAEVLAAGAPLEKLDVMSIRSVNSWLVPEEIESFLAAMGVGTGPELTSACPEAFSLPGRPKLEGSRTLVLLGDSSCPAGSNWNFYSWREGGDGGCQLLWPRMRGLGGPLDLEEIPVRAAAVCRRRVIE